MEEMSPPLPEAPIQLWSPDPSRFSILAAVPGGEDQEESQILSKTPRGTFAPRRFSPVPAVPREDIPTLPSPSLPVTLPSLTTPSTTSPPSSNSSPQRFRDQPSFLPELVDAVHVELSRRPKQAESTVSNLSSPNSIPEDPFSKNSSNTAPPQGSISSSGSGSRSSSSSRERKAYKKCQGSCVQRFCLPVQDLQVYETCQNKCRDLCL